MLSVIRAEIDLLAFRHNVRQLRHAAGEAVLMGVVKADAYGHGALACARALVEEGAAKLAVATVGEAEALRAAGIEAPLLVFAAPLPDALPAYIRGGFGATVSSPEAAAFVQKAAQTRGPLAVHVKVDTGMHRLGVAPSEAAAIVRRLQDAPGVHVEGLWTHLATADEADASYVEIQAEQFRGVLRALGDAVPPVVHVANGPALVRGLIPGLGLDPAQTAVRVGGALYGLASSASLRPAHEALGLRPVMRLASRVVHLQTVAAGEGVSYGRTWVADRPTRVATVAAGYADGMPRAYRGPVTIRGAEAPVVGRVCMDMLMVSLGDPAGQGASVQIGDEAVLFGPGGVSAEEAADTAGTISYELTSGLTARVPRVGVTA